MAQESRMGGGEGGHGPIQPCAFFVRAWVCVCVCVCVCGYTHVNLVLFQPNFANDPSEDFGVGMDSRGKRWPRGEKSEKTASCIHSLSAREKKNLPEIRENAMKSG